MATTKDLIGIWRGDAMFVPNSQIYEVLVFRMDGTGFLDFYIAGRGGDDRFRWSFVPPKELQLTGDRLPLFDSDGQLVATPQLDASVEFEMAIEEISPPSRVRTLRLANSPWVGASSRYRYGGDGWTYALFRAPCFEAADEAADQLFRGKLLSAFLADGLRARGVYVSKVNRVFMGACYYRSVEVNGQQVGLAVNWDFDFGKWWLRFDSPCQGTGDEVETLCQMIRPILESVPDLSELEWLSDDDMDERDKDRKRQGGGAVSQVEGV